jgi:PleD family two-component response regulator
VRVSASIGLAMAEPGTPFEEALQEADQAMYGAKADGRGRLHGAPLPVQRSASVGP